jgi:hypothetical protein
MSRSWADRGAWTRIGGVRSGKSLISSCNFFAADDLYNTRHALIIYSLIPDIDIS